MGEPARVSAAMASAIRDFAFIWNSCGGESDSIPNQQGCPRRRTSAEGAVGRRYRTWPYQTWPTCEWEIIRSHALPGCRYARARSNGIFYPPGSATEPSMNKNTWIVGSVALLLMT